MKLQLDENTLNAYINEAIRQELAENNTDELFGRRVRKQSRRMITGQGWGNQKRSQNGFMAANSDISATDADEVVPQTLVGMIKQMDKGLATIEQAAGMNGQYEGLGEKVAAYRNGGGFKMKQSLLNAIGALSRLADRLNAVERTSGSNAIMESNANRNGNYLDATAASNAAIGNARNIGQLNKQGVAGNVAKTAGENAANVGARTAAEVQKDLNAVRHHKTQMQALHTQVDRMGNPANREKLGKIADEIRKLSQKEAELTRELSTASKAAAPSTGAKIGAEASNVGKNTGFWGKQLANQKNAWETLKDAGNAGKKAGDAAKTAKAAKLAGAGVDAAKATKAVTRAGRAARLGKTLSQGLSAIGRLSQIPLLLLSIADEAARQGAEARQRKIVRTYNCASVLAKRMANIAQEIADAQGGQEEAETTEQLQEINVRKSRRFFESIESGMNELSAVMKQIYAQLKGQSTSNGNELPTSLNTPEEISQFQEWANARGFRDERGQELVPDGIWGTHTEHAYDQAAVAQRQGQLEESRKPINEANAVMRALTDLENKVGVTGSGGRGYSDISRMSGAYNGSRSQGARAAKFIIRTYPPVLNQYLGVLNDAGANVQGIQPLKVDNRPHRDYDWNEVQEIDTRIKQLLNIANNLEVQPGPGRRGNVTLPPKPVRQSSQTQNPGNQQQRAPEVPELDNTVEVEDEPIGPIEDEPIEMKPNEPLSVTKFGYANPKTGEQLQPWQYVDSIIDYMKDALNGDTNSIRSKRKEMREIYQKAWDTIDQNMRTGVYTEEQAMAQKKKLNYYYRQFKRGKEDITPRYTVSEEVFKKLVKQIIRESMNY